MTFNATSPKIQQAKAAGLVEHSPLRPPPELVRCILCPPHVDAQLAGKDATHGLPSIGVAVTVGRFVAGHALTISRKKRPKKWRGPDIELEQLEGIDEVWVLCYRRPSAGWRILGRFLEKDVLVLLRVYDKRDIGSDYGPAAAKVIEDWIGYFGTLQPCKGNDLSAYLSGAHYDVDKPTQI